MKKMLLILAVGMLSLQANAVKNSNLRGCTAHYYLNVRNAEGEIMYVSYGTAYADTCAQAAEAAKAIAHYGVAVTEAN